MSSVEPGGRPDKAELLRSWTAFTKVKVQRRLAMIPVVERHREDLIALCKENEIKGLWLFGSAATGEWDPERSDLDFLFDIGEYDKTAGRRSMRLYAGLERLFGENIDIISRPAIKRPEFRDSIDSTAISIYER